MTNFSLCLPPRPALCWGRKSADRYWIPECVAEHRGLGVMDQLVVELGGDWVHQSVVLNSHYVTDVGHDQVTFQLRGNLVVSNVILSKLSTAWWVSLLMLNIQLVEPAQIHKMIKGEWHLLSYLCRWQYRDHCCGIYILGPGPSRDI